jgi:hypothetical protein
MSREFKSIPCFSVKAANADGRTRTGIAAVMGNIDDGGDRLHPGAFKRTIDGGEVRHKHLWGHDWGRPPIASIKELREIPRSELPPEVLGYAPDATGGLLVTREYFKSELSDLVLQCIDSGDMEMSIGYAAKQVDYTELEDGARIRELKEVQLLETSDVPFGMNPATVAAFAKAAESIRPLGAILGELMILEHNIKAGRRNNAQDTALIKQLHQISLDLGFDLCTMNDETDGKSVTNPNATGSEPAPVLTDTALRANALKVNDLRLHQLLRRSEHVCNSSET